MDRNFWWVLKDLEDRLQMDSTVIKILADLVGEPKNAFLGQIDGYQMIYQHFTNS